MDTSRLPSPTITWLRRAAAASCVTLLLACVGGGDDHADVNLDAKLDRQFARYASAGDLVVERNRDTTLPLERRTIARGEWEAAIALAPDDAWSERDLGLLRTRHAQRIAQARETAIRLSAIDFGALRSLPAAESARRIGEFCAAVPKGGMLHVHPWGNLNQDTYRALLERRNPVIPAAELASTLADTRGRAWLYPDELTWLRSLPAAAPYLSLAPADRERLVAMSALPAGSHPFERFEAVFNFVAIVLGGDWENLAASYDDFAARAVKGGVTYVEFTDSLSPEELPGYVALFARLEQKYGLTVRYNVAYFRTDTPADQNTQVLQMLREIDSPLITGIDLLANEGGTPALENGQAVYGPVLADVRLRGGKWRRTMHAGELGDARNPRDALLLGAERLGHGVRLIEDPVTLEYAARRGIPVEINLTSNLKLRTVDDIRRHPYLDYLRLGLPVSLSTDDEGIFRTDIVAECVLAVGQTDVTYHEFKEMALNSIRAAFAAGDVRQRLLQDLLARFERFERL